MCWLHVIQGTDWELTDFSKEVSLVTYGDDNACNVSHRVVDMFNQNVCIEFMPSIGLTYTSERKDEVIVPNYRSLEEITFLKRGFRKEPLVERYVAPLDMTTIVELPYWVRQTGVEEQTVHVNFEKALEELSMHDEHTWNEWFPIMRDGYFEKC